jgi:hypothetical protein
MASLLFFSERRLPLTRTSTPGQTKDTFIKYRNVVSIRSHIGIATAQTVVETSVGTEAGVSFVVGIRRVVGFEVPVSRISLAQIPGQKGRGQKNLLCHCIGLIVRNGIYIAESSAGRVGDGIRFACRVNDCALGLPDRMAGIDFCCADIGQVWAAVVGTFCQQT